MKPLPEERLLKLLRAKPRLTEPSVAGGGTLQGRPGVSAVVVAQPKHSPVELVVVALSVVLAVEAVLVVVQLVRPLPPVPAASSSLVLVAPAEAELPSRLPAGLPEAPSVAASAPRPLFTPPAEAGPTETARRAPPSSAAKQLVARLTLLGIIAGTPPQAIIEDTESKKSFFVAQGQAIVDGAILDQVFDTYVVLDLSGEKFELRL